MRAEWTRNDLLPEQDLPRAVDVIEDGRTLAKSCPVGISAFLRHYDVDSEFAYKCSRMASKDVMIHVQIGFRDLEKSRRAYREIFEQTGQHGGRVDRYGICLDWSMGYRRDDRKGRQKGTGLILETDEAFCDLTQSAPVAPHFGDFVLGMPAALENTMAALRAGSTTIGNMGQYFCFRLPNWNDDVDITVNTVKAIALCAAQPVPILIHSNVDDGFAAVFTDLCCALGAVMLERYVVEELLGCRMGHCYGHTFSEPLTRWAFQRSLARLDQKAGRLPTGTMVYGNTTAYGNSNPENYAALASYLGIDIAAQLALPSGHGINPIPLSEARRIPDIDETVDACVFATHLLQAVEKSPRVSDFTAIDDLVETLLTGARRFFDNILSDFSNKGIDTSDALEMLLSIKRLGARSMESLYGPGDLNPSASSGRQAWIETPIVGEISTRAETILARLDLDLEVFQNANFKVCIATTDVHEYGKTLLTRVLNKLDVTIIDGGVSTDPDALAECARNNDVHAIALSTYNGIALRFMEKLKNECESLGFRPMIFVGGKLNQIPEDSNTSLPVDITSDLESVGAITCDSVEQMIIELAQSATRQYLDQ